jgi:hypothetical protein
LPHGLVPALAESLNADPNLFANVLEETKPQYSRTKFRPNIYDHWNWDPSFHFKKATPQGCTISYSYLRHFSARTDPFLGCLRLLTV